LKSAMPADCGWANAHQSATTQSLTRGRSDIGSDVNLSAVQIWTGQHDWESATFAYEKAPVTIRDHALSARVIILPGVTIGEGAVAAAGAVVSRDVELHAGRRSTCQEAGERPSPMTYELALPRGSRGGGNPLAQADSSPPSTSESLW
jgi:hypothetical protein